MATEPSRLSTRLRELVKARAQVTPAYPRGAPDSTSTARDVPLNRARLARALGGAWLETEAGPCLVVEREYGLERGYGRFRVGDAAGDPAGLAILGELYGASAPAPDPGTLMFVDLETTGLSGGAGTYAFLVGFAFFDEGMFCTRQFFMPGYGHERALLAAVAAAARRAAWVVTFNGKAFDLPVMEGRYLLHRLSVPFDALPHLDMLHVARRLWGGPRGRRGEEWEASCSLGALERTRLGVVRGEDVPGAEIPARYFHYVRGGDADLLAPVFEHNRYDLLSLAVLTGLAGGRAAAGAASVGDLWECVGLGRIYERVGRFDQAAACYTRAAAWDDAAGDPLARGEALRRLARGLRRERRHHEAALVWKRLLDLGPMPAPVAHEALEALAVHYEHRASDLPTARACALRALDVARDGRHGSAARHRLARLERKLAVRASGGRSTARRLP